MRRGDDRLVWTAAGGLGALALGVALVPFRGLTPASNLAFAFLALTIVVAELGGRGAALATALVSAMSLNFFLTEPYLTLTITKTDDVVAFVALAACGLIAAAFGSRRARWSEAAGRAGIELDVLRRLADGLCGGATLDAVADQVRQAFRLDAVVLRDAGGDVLAAAPAAAARRTVPEHRLDGETLLPAGGATVRFGARGLRIPEGGGRLRIEAGGGAVFVELWEDAGEGFRLDEGRTLGIAATFLALEALRRHAVRHG